MRKSRIIGGFLAVAMFLMVGCSSVTRETLQGFYQSYMKNGYCIQFSFLKEDNTFVGYINNIEINKGTYESLGDGNFILKGDTGDIEIKLEKNNSFRLNLGKLSENLNEGKPIELNNIDDVPIYFEQIFSDEEKEKIENLLK